MPILDVSVVGEPVLREGLAQRLADAAGRALDSRPGGTWVTLRVVDAQNYAENGGAREGPPVFVRLIERSLPEGEALSARIIALTNAVADACGRDPTHVHVIVEPPGAGRVAFGGRLV